MMVWNEEVEVEDYENADLHGNVLKQSSYPLEQDQSALQAGFDGYLSDASDEMHPLRPLAPQQQPLPDKDSRDGRKYLQRNVMATPEQPEPSALPKGETSPPPPPRPSRSSFNVLSRRLSLGTNRSVFTRSRSETNTMPRKSGSFFATNNASASHNAWQKSTRSRVSWLGTIKMRIKGERHTASISGDVADTEPIAKEYLRDEGLHEKGAPDAALAPAEKDLSMPRYPRLRSQPSLCKSSKRVSKTDDVSFVPDTENLDTKRLSTNNTPRTFQRQPSKKSPFLLPDSSSSARFPSSSSLN
ncbi:hypothetical protein J3B02_000152 [Coemansia erecta]|uniref:Uncharacterized protein n=1 Tax=Coemansia asiatica TaxID=1052880 RepID=A0A9W7XQR7_9FUNG|nr:hypothetical protein LPJ64_000200 [Coemansia asiatica]KAJ2858561.1 hypothetical protein J3B02_000152 [Coemansia erecta]KAJ2889257.1 hypothetical protein FB639_000034 [Coemansia asiatica]